MVMVKEGLSLEGKWQASLNGLKAYIASNPHIKIERHSVSIPAEYREEFYELFHRVRQEMVQSLYGEMLEQAQELSRHYAEVEKRITKAHYNTNDRDIILMLENQKKEPDLWQRIIGRLHRPGFKLEAIVLEVHLDEFLHRPLESLSRLLFDPLFSLLQDKIGITAFEGEIGHKVTEEFNALYQSGYNRWLVLQLVELLQMDKLYRVASNIISTKAAIKQEVRGINRKEGLPLPKESNFLGFDNGRGKRTLSSVDVLFHSKLLNKYIGIKTKYETAANIAGDAPEHRPKEPLKTAKPALIHSPLLIYTGNSLREAILVADKDSFWRPDLAVFTIKTNCGEGVNYINQLKSLTNTFIVQLPSPKSDALCDISFDWNCLNIGFDTSKLDSIVEALT